jgi:hypothetical protein
MRFIFMAAVLAVFAAPSIAQAESWTRTKYCYDVCIQKCQTAVAIGTHFRTMTECIRVWSKRNQEDAERRGRIAK